MFNDDIQARAYAQLLSSPLYGTPLLDPSGSDRPEIGDVGYIRRGRFVKLFTAAIPDSRDNPYRKDRTANKNKRRPQTMSEKNPFEPAPPPNPVVYPNMLATEIPAWENDMIWNYRYSLPREVNDGSSSKFCTVETGVSLRAPPAWGHVSNHKIWAKLVAENCREWLDYAEAHAPPDVVEDGIVFVTGYIKASRDWDMYFRVRDQQGIVGEEVRAGYECGCGITPKFRHSVSCKKLKVDYKAAFDQTMFLSHYKMKRRPPQLSTLASKPQRPIHFLRAPVHHDNKGFINLMNEKSVSNQEDVQGLGLQTVFKHPVDWTLDYIFDTSPDADVAFVSEHQIFKICKVCDTQPLIQEVCHGEVHGKSWNTMNFYFYLQYHRPKLVVYDGVATIDTSSESLFSFLCQVPLYKPLRTMFVYTKVRNSRVPPEIPPHPPTNAFLEIRVVSPTFEKESSHSDSQVVMRQQSPGPIFRVRHY